MSDETLSPQEKYILNIFTTTPGRPYRAADIVQEVARRKRVANLPLATANQIIDTIFTLRDKGLITHRVTKTQVGPRRFYNKTTYTYHPPEPPAPDLQPGTEVKAGGQIGSFMYNTTGPYGEVCVVLIGASVKSFYPSQIEVL